MVKQLCISVPSKLYIKKIKQNVELEVFIIPDKRRN